MPCRVCGNPKLNMIWSGPVWKYCSFRCMTMHAMPFYMIMTVIFVVVLLTTLDPIYLLLVVIFGTPATMGYKYRKQHDYPSYQWEPPHPGQEMQTTD